MKQARAAALADGSGTISAGRGRWLNLRLWLLFWIVLLFGCSFAMVVAASAGE